ncbi:C40 family peptidase [Lactobacillus delbrueckii]|uniref:C40 family peptidase n=1 Tax=Lactobacillus delbrueckii TaxID=1584 RepID=UPI001E6519AE|nr:C40 family peptidase [Lactobacillus delbrueckii]MCD5504913.1 C40 family peptidase [Lactobacillus delbrueckii subsp. lactis]
MKQFKQILVKLTLALALVVPIAVQANSHQAQAASVTTKRNKVVKLAKKQVGKRYVYGATGPYSFDCSGLTSYVYSRSLGKYITRTTYTQVKKGKTVRVSTASLKKGDLLFWGSKSSPYHVGIYVGGGQYVHAATPSQGVRKQYLSSYFWPSTAKRVI